MHACKLALANLDSTRQPMIMIMHDIWKYAYNATIMHMHVHTEI